MPKPSQVPGRETAANDVPARREPDVVSAAHEAVPAGGRRQFTAAEKLRLVRAADAAIASGERGVLQAMMRREGIYSSHLSTWRRQLGAGGEAGLASRKPGRKPKLDATGRALLAVTKERDQLARKLRVANALIDLQKKAHELLGLTLPEPPEDES